MSRLRVLAATVLLASALPLALSTALASPADAATCRAQTVPAYTRSARAVFTGTVTGSDGVPRTDGQPGQVFTQDVTVDRVYTGSVSSSEVTVQTDKIAKQCTLGRLVTGTSYVFFATGDGQPWLAAGGGGTQVSSPTLVAEVEDLLGSGRQPVAPERVSATFTRADDSGVPATSRLVAPGVALVLVGLLGLLVVGRLGRRTT